MKTLCTILIAAGCGIIAGASFTGYETRRETRALLTNLKALETRLYKDAADARRNADPVTADAIEAATMRFEFLREQSGLNQDR